MRRLDQRVITGRCQESARDRLDRLVDQRADGVHHIVLEQRCVRVNARGYAADDVDELERRAEGLTGQRTSTRLDRPSRQQGVADAVVRMLEPDC